MSEVRSGYFYTKEHEWVTIEENFITLGVTDYAQQSLGDIVFVELPGIDQEISKDESFGVVESVKAVSDLYIPVSGTVIEVNETLSTSPEIVNSDPYEEGWILKVQTDMDAKELEEYVKTELMTHEEYKSFIEEEEEE